MINKYLLASILVLLGSSGLAHAQVAPSTPMPESQFEPTYGPYVPALYSKNVQTENKVRPNHPILGHIARTVMTPIRAATGHLAPPTSAVTIPSKEDVARMVADGGYSPAEITAAKIKIDEAQAMARRAAVRYLATVDCHYYPEAETGIIAALRADRSETVRLEAAMALGNCQVLSPKMLEALNLTALALELDGNPAEVSERVRNAAKDSLSRCTHRGLCLSPADSQPMPAPADWIPPYPITVEPAGYAAPFVPPVSQKERDLAQTVSSRPKSAAAPTGTRSLIQFLQSLTFGRDANRDPQNDLDPRLRGLSPLGSERILAIPTSPPIPDTLASPYYFQQ